MKASTWACSHAAAITLAFPCDRFTLADVSAIPEEVNRGLQRFPRTRRWTAFLRSLLMRLREDEHTADVLLPAALADAHAKAWQGAKRAANRKTVVLSSRDNLTRFRGRRS